MTINPFHLAIPVQDLEKARRFYRDAFGCTEGRSDASWVDLNLYGHQLVLHEVREQPSRDLASNPVDSHDVPVPHFGVVLEWEDWEALAAHLKSAGTEFIIEPYIRFEGEPGEQATLFLLDPSGNALEFKSFKDRTQLFAT